MTVGGLSIALGVGGGLFWTLAGVVLGFAVAVINAWVLLVEINRYARPLAHWADERFAVQRHHRDRIRLGHRCGRPGLDIPCG